MILFFKSKEDKELIKAIKFILGYNTKNQNYLNLLYYINLLNQMNLMKDLSSLVMQS